MKRRTVIGLVLGLLYGAAWLVIPAAGHDHHHGEEHCAVCVWQTVAQTDTPILAIQPVYSELSQTIAWPAIVKLVGTFALPTASRAPPEPLA
jgi:hypothetical protein